MWHHHGHAQMQHVAGHGHRAVHRLAHVASPPSPAPRVIGPDSGACLASPAKLKALATGVPASSTLGGALATAQGKAVAGAMGAGLLGLGGAAGAAFAAASASGVPGTNAGGIGQSGGLTPFISTGLTTGLTTGLAPAGLGGGQTTAVTYAPIGPVPGPVPVPEPASIAVLAIAVAVLALVRWRRFGKAAVA